MNIFKQFFKSLYSPKDIATFHKQGFGKTFLYILLLSLIAVLPIYIYVVNYMNHFIEELEDTVVNDIPDFHIQNGILISNSTEPIYIDKHGITIIFDSTGTVTVSEAQNSPNTVSFLQKDMVMNLEGQTDTLSYASLDLDISKDQLVPFFESINSISSAVYIVVFLIFYLFQLGGELIKITVLALFGLIMASSLKLSIAYGQLWKLSTYAITLPVVFFTIMNAVNAVVPFSFFINWGVMLIMLYLILKEMPKEDLHIN